MSDPFTDNNGVWPGGILLVSGLFTASTRRKDFVILQLYWWLFSNTKLCR